MKHPVVTKEITYLWKISCSKGVNLDSFVLTIRCHSKCRELALLQVGYMTAVSVTATESFQSRLCHTRALVKHSWHSIFFTFLFSIPLLSFSSLPVFPLFLFYTVPIKLCSRSLMLCIMAVNFDIPWQNAILRYLSRHNKEYSPNYLPKIGSKERRVWPCFNWRCAWGPVEARSSGQERLLADT